MFAIFFIIMAHVLCVSFSIFQFSVLRQKLMADLKMSRNITSEQMRESGQVVCQCYEKNVRVYIRENR